MPYSINFERPPAGVATTSVKGGQSAEIRMLEFTSTEDGQTFIQRLEGFPSDILELLKPQTHVKASEVDHMLAVFDKTGATTVYVNELNTTLGVRLNRPCNKGAAIHKSDIVEINHMEISDVEIPATAGVLYLFSMGWRKGLFFDFQPLAPDELTEQICDEVLKRLDDFTSAWKNHVAFNEHMPLLTRAAERFKDKDFISCCAILYPRIEGLLRTHLRMTDPAAKATQLQMAGSAVSAKCRSDYSLLLPLRFESYLKEVFFSNFEPEDPKIDISRNSVGHGVAHHESFSMKAATISLLVIHQLFYCFET